MGNDKTLISQIIEKQAAKSKKWNLSLRVRIKLGFLLGLTNIPAGRL